MKKNVLSIGKIIVSTLLVLVFSIVTVLPIPVVTGADSNTTVYLDTPTINGTVIGQEFNVSIMIRDADRIDGWAAGMIFNATLLNCTGFFEGEFLKNVGTTKWQKGTINNTVGEIGGHACLLWGVPPGVYASGDGRLAYLTFKVKAAGVSDLHLRDVVVGRELSEIPVNIIDVYTAIVGTTPHTVVTVSNSTGKTGWYHSGFYAHAFNPTFKMFSFNVTSPKPSFSNVTIPKVLLPPPEPPIEWKVVIDGDFVDRTVTENSTHTSIYFTYSLGIHKVQITPRMRSTISIALSSNLILPEENVTISGNIIAEDTVRQNVSVTIFYRPSDGTWNTLDVVKTDLDGNYTYSWKPEAAGTYEVMTRWEGDENTLGDESNVLSLTVAHVFEVEGLKVFIETNSTIFAESFNFSRPFKQISFNTRIPQGTIGFFNITLPKGLLNVSTLDEWKLIIDDVPPLKTEERIVTENATHYFIYFNCTAGIHEVQITTRMMSTISMFLSEDSINLGSSVTISGSINPMNRSVSVTIRYKIWESGENWITLDTVTTDTNGNYTYPWTPGTAAIYYVMARWEGDEISIGAKSDETNLTVVGSSVISIALSSTNVPFGLSVTISGTIDPPRLGMPVTIRYRKSGEASWSSAGQNYTDQNGEYTLTWAPHKVIAPDKLGTYEVKAEWPGYPYPPPPDPFILGAESNVLSLTVKWTSTISIALSPTNITQGKSVTISGNIAVADNIARANENVTILYRLSGAADWNALTVETDESGNYTYAWTPDAAGTYEVMARWLGDDVTFGNESIVLTLTVKEAPTVFPIEIVAVVVVAIIVIAAIVVYFVKFRKP
ncbi:MAG: Ig-like domain repeat protein [Candidatus Bathyarchaeaceae archaeon]